MAITIPHFSIPFRFADVGQGAPSVVVEEQDSEQEILDCVETIMRYEQNYRIEKPTFGIPDQVFSTPTPNVERILEALDVQEPRAEAVISVSPDEFDSLISNVKMSVGVVGE